MESDWALKGLDKGTLIDPYLASTSGILELTVFTCTL